MIIVIIAILAWVVAVSLSSMKYKEEAFAYYSMYRAVREQHQYLMRITDSEVKKVRNNLKNPMDVFVFPYEGLGSAAIRLLVLSGIS